jgi:hypothetical protein
LTACMNGAFLQWEVKSDGSLLLAARSSGYKTVTFIRFIETLIIYTRTLEPQCRSTLYGLDLISNLKSRDYIDIS